MSSISASMLPALLGRPVAYQPVFTRLPGVTVQGAIFLSQALFLCNTPTAQRRDGWFWKEQAGAVDSWESETGMSAKQQVTARRQLVAIGVLEEVRKGVPAKTWYRVNSERLAEALALALEPEKTADKPRRSPDSPKGRNCNLPTGETRIAQPERTESPDGSFLTETTTEITPSLSDAGEPNVFQRAAQQTDDGTPVEPADRYQSMTLGWEPDVDVWQRACWDRGITPDADVSDALIDFREHFAANPGRTGTTADWTRRFARWVHENLKRQAAQADQSHSGGFAHDRTTDQPSNDRAEREAIRRQLADPHDTSWADGWWPDESGDAAPGSGAGAGGPGVHPAGGDLPPDVFECVPECGQSEPEQTRTGDGAGAVAGTADPEGGGAGHERAEARGEYLAADDPCPGGAAGADTGGFRHAANW